ncbi:MAG: methionyl-tRNA formyltransferase [Actinomycetota bacterium]|nr:methionyl-tRNA formyltransferase [Actinomycetota bacterium]
MRTVFLGTSDFAGEVLRTLARSEHRPQLVVTRPDRPRGRGRRLQPPPVATVAAELGLPTVQPDDLHAPESLEVIAGAEPQALCVCAYGVLIREPLMSLYELVNVHPSLLPRWRGAAPIERAIMAGDERTGVSIMRLVAELDAGPVCLQAQVAISGEDDAGTLGERLQDLGGRLLVRALSERPPYREQPSDGVTYAEKVEARDRLLDAGNSAEAEAHRVRALRPHIGARLRLPDDSFLGVHEAAIHETPVPAGEVRVGDGLMLLGCADRALALLRIQPPGGKPMPVGDWLRGHADVQWLEGPVPTQP